MNSAPTSLEPADQRSVKHVIEVRLAPGLVRGLDAHCRARQIDREEGVRRAIALWNYLELQQEAGGDLAIVEHSPGRSVITKIDLT